MMTRGGKQALAIVLEQFPAIHVRFLSPAALVD